MTKIMTSKLLQIGSSRFFSIFSESAISFIIPILALEIDGKIQDSGWVLFFFFTCKLLGYPLAGALCDYFSARWILFVTSVMRLFFCAFMGWKFSNVGPNIMLLSLLGAFNGLTGGISTIAYETLGPKLFSNNQFRHYQAVVQIADQLGFIFAPIIAAFLLKFSTSSGILYDLGVSFGLSGIVFIAYSKDLDSKKITQTKEIHQFYQSINMIWKQPEILRTLLLTVLDNALLGLYIAFATPLAISVFHRTESDLGSILTLAYAGGLISVYLSHQIHKYKSIFWIWKYSYYLAYLGMFLLCFASNFALFGISIFLIECSCAIGIYALRIIRAKTLPQDDFGKLSGILFLLQQSTLPLGGLIVALIPRADLLQRTLAFFSIFAGSLTLIIFVSISNYSGMNKPDAD